MSIQKTKRPILHTKNGRTGKIHNVKSSSERQVKAQLLNIFLRGILILISCFLQNLSAADAFDFFFFDGNIYTVNERQPHAEALAVKNGRIAFVGSREGA